MCKTSLHSNEEIINAIFFDVDNIDQIKLDLMSWARYDLGAAQKFQFANKYNVDILPKFLTRLESYKKQGKLKDIFTYLKTRYINGKLNNIVNEIIPLYSETRPLMINELNKHFKLELPDDLSQLPQSNLLYPKIDLRHHSPPQKPPPEWAELLEMPLEYEKEELEIYNREYRRDPIFSDYDEPDN